MAGDHKCPVCQATFTRPQHVARHMRSHTGDRPYKCQHCGDQFARSDLLSRHVNKCHASEKPPTTTAPTRRKGQQGPASTRATTSKQACDQCVIATLPCDGCNPCSKCLQRNVGCTFVKFQRQTAPSGPGHKHSQSLDSAISPANLAAQFPRPEDLFLGPPPMSVPSMASGDPYYDPSLPQHQPFAFQNQGWDAFDSPTAPPLSLSATTTESGEIPSPDMGSRYGALTDFMRREGLVHPETTIDPALMAGIYGMSHSRQGDPFNPIDLEGDFAPSSHQRRRSESNPGMHDYDVFPQQYLSGPGAPVSNYLAHQSSGLDFLPPAGGLHNYQNRRGSISQISDSSGTHSGGNSAASSSLHLPLIDNSIVPQNGDNPYGLDSYLGFNDPTQQRPPPSRDGRFSAAFGGMSLQDAAALAAGYNTDDNAPFFSGAAMKMPPEDSTPRPFRGDGLMAEAAAANAYRDRETEMRELREFWKLYLRTPLSGPPLGATPKAENVAAPFGARPSPKRGLSRVASLPSVRTPSDEKGLAYLSRLGQQHSEDDASVSRVQEDLKSYEQAVLARKAPTNLSLAPRKARPKAASTSPLSEQARSPSLQNGFLEPTAAARNPYADTASSTQSARPSFKRLPSQTLGPANPKRIFRWSEDSVDDTDSDAEFAPDNKDEYRMQFSQAMFDRYRRGTAAAPTNPTPA